MRYLLQRCLWRHGSIATWAINGTKSIVTRTHEGNMREHGMDGTPGSATRTWQTQYNGIGRMVGAFGANKQ